MVKTDQAYPLLNPSPQFKIWGGLEMMHEQSRFITCSALHNSMYSSAFIPAFVLSLWVRTGEGEGEEYQVLWERKVELLDLVYLGPFVSVCVCVSMSLGATRMCVHVRTHMCMYMYVCVLQCGLHSCTQLQTHRSILTFHCHCMVLCS